MNDFTKEELESLLGCVEADNWIYADRGKSLQRKLQSMIDNYCEIKIPTMDDYVCFKCNEEWHQCECNA
jgi:hypothetical protein